MDVHVINLLGEFGITCEAAGRRGWGGLNNGELVAAAIEAGFTCILTQDRRFAESAAHMLRAGASISLVVVRLPQRPWRDYVRDFRTAWMTQPIKPVPGAAVHWPAAGQGRRPSNA
jgi:hypothetical protein